MKRKIIEDLHHILFGLKLQTTDDWDIAVDMAKCVLRKFHVHALGKEYMPDAQYWAADTDVEDHFFDLVCPGKGLSLTAFEYLANQYFDWQRWYDVRKAAAMLTDRTAKVIEAADKEYEVVAVHEPVNRSSMFEQLAAICNPANNPAIFSNVKPAA
jgi:hypothetical protein